MPQQSNAKTPTSGHIIGQDYQPALNSSSCNVMSELSSTMNQEDTNSSSSFLRIQSPTASNSNNLVNQHKSNANISNVFVDVYESMHKQTNSVSSNAFDSMFQHSSATNVCDDLIVSTVTPKSALGGTGAAPALIPPGMFAAPSPAAATETLQRPVEPLTRNQLLQAFNYLLRTDSEFMNKLHEAYVKSFSELLS